MDDFVEVGSYGLSRVKLLFFVGWDLEGRVGVEEDVVGEVIVVVDFLWLMLDDFDVL